MLTIHMHVCLLLTTAFANATLIQITGPGPDMGEIKSSLVKSSENLFPSTPQCLGTQGVFIILNLDIEFKQVLYSYRCRSLFVCLSISRQSPKLLLLSSQTLQPQKPLCVIPRSTFRFDPKSRLLLRTVFCFWIIGTSGFSIHTVLCNEASLQCKLLFLTLTHQARNA